MPSNPDSVLAPLKLQGLPDLACFKCFEDLLQALPSYLFAEIPITITNIVFSSTQPLDTQRDYIWFRRDNSGGFLGIYLYVGGQWQQIYPTPNGIFRMYGDSRDIPPGYLLADADNPNLTAAMATHLETQWLLDPTLTYYVIFDVTYEGF